MDKYLLIFLFLLIQITLLIKAENDVEVIDNTEEEDEETFYKGTVIKFLNLTEIEEGEEVDDDINISATVKRFNETFYNQLNGNERKVFDYLYEECSQERPKLKFNGIMDSYVEKTLISMDRIMSSFVLDNPQFWWIESYSISLKNAYKALTEDNYKKVSNITVDFVTDSIIGSITEEDLYEMNQELKLETDLLVYQIELMGIHSKYELLKYLHDYIIRNTVYDSTGPWYVHTIYGPLVKHVSVCSGYSEVFKYIASLFGINVIMARSLTHEWNYVYINKKWYIVDVTWDDPSIPKQIYDYDNNTWKDIIHRPDKGDYSNLVYDYFLVGSDAFKGDDVALKEHKIIYSYFTKNSVLYYPDPDTKKFEFDPAKDEYVERILSNDEIDVISDTELNLESYGRKTISFVSTLLLLPILFNIILQYF